MNGAELDLRKFYKACNPSKTLNVENPEDRKYYIDFSSVRGARTIEEMRRTITVLSPDEPTCQLFTGHIGCGKSTELLWLKHELESQNFHVAYFEATEDIDIGDVDISDVLLSIVGRVSESLEKVGIRLRPNYFQRLFGEITDILNTPFEPTEIEFSAGIAKITAQTRASSKQRDKLREYLEPRTSSLIDSINEQLLRPAIDTLTAKNKRGLVVIIDNLDRVLNTLKPDGHTQPEYLFIDRGDQLKGLQCHVVYSIPLVLTFANQLEMMIYRFGVQPQILPMVRVRTRDGQEFEEGIKKMRQMVLARAFPNIEPQQRLDLITQVFDSPKTLDRLCCISGGHVRNLLVLLFSSLQKGDSPISREILEDVIRGRRDMLSRVITIDEWDLLAEVKEQKWVSGEENYKTLIPSLFVFQYQDEGGIWFSINPILETANQLKNLTKNIPINTENK